ncbi:MAG: hypothetical protein U5K33_06295 [Halofilum sp. (in: g-proteobacteria)]|nr:hypothetical protein [Halofilum sp. (in: g-proteobacteria)]
MAFAGDGIAALCLRPPRRDQAAVLGPVTWLNTGAADGGEALEQWIHDERLGGMRAVGVLAPGDYQTVQVEAPQVPANEMRQAAAWRVRELIDFPIDQAVIDTWDPPESTRRGQPQINVVVARRSMVAERIEMLRDAGLELTAIDIPELVQRNICAHLPTSQNGHALLSLEHGSGLLTFFRDGEQYLARGLDVGHGDLAGGDEKAAEALVLEVQRSLDYYGSAMSQPPPGGLYLYPGGELAETLVDALRDNLDNLDCQPVTLADLVTVEDEPTHAGATTLHALGAGLRDQTVLN